MRRWSSRTAGRVDYTYDALDRLTREAITDAVLGDRTFDYTYDAVGNRLTRNDSAAGLTEYSYDANDRLLTETLGRRADAVHLRRQRQHVVAGERHGPRVLQLGLRQPPDLGRYRWRRHNRRAQRL